ncbi:MAG: exonuclease I [Aestuariivita sp.]|nr:exonuclease I [Aestuariivita sp.]
MDRFVFYDLETTGVSPAFDQALQFAAIVTDADFNKLDSVDQRCRLAPHILPSPKALHVTGVKPEQATNSNLPNTFEFAQMLQEFTKKWSPAIWIGYNSINFDEAFLRQMFYQNLQPNIYATQNWENSRLDVMKMVWAAYVKVPDSLKWPMNENGSLNFKLDRLAPNNGFSSHNAHDALGDVEATIFILQKIKSASPKLYADLIETCDKNYVNRLLHSFKPVEVTLRFGAQSPRTYVGCFCGAQKGNQNKIGFFDLEQDDPMGLIFGSEEDVCRAIEGSPKRIRPLAINQAETFQLAKPSSDSHTLICATIEENPKFREMVSKALAGRFSNEADSYQPVEEKIYNGFIPNSDKNLLDQFQQADWQERYEIIRSLKDDRLRQLGQRLVAFYAPELLSKEQVEKFKKFVRSKWEVQDNDVSWTTVDEVADQLKELDDEGADKKFINDLRRFFEFRLTNYQLELPN